MLDPPTSNFALGIQCLRETPSHFRNSFMKRKDIGIIACLVSKLSSETSKNINKPQDAYALPRISSPCIRHRDYKSASRIRLV